MSLPAALAAQLRGDTLEVALLSEFAFASGTERLCSLAGPSALITNDGRAWRPTAGFGEVSGLGSVADMGSRPVTFSLPRADGLEPEAFDAAAQADLDADVVGRAVRVWLQVIDAETGQPLDLPLALWSGVMSAVRVEWSDIGAARITLSAENVFAEKRKPAFGMLTGQDQRARFAGDAGLDYVEALVNRRVTWPRD